MIYKYLISICFLFVCFSCNAKKEKHTDIAEESAEEMIVTQEVEDSEPKTLLDSLYESGEYWVDIPVTYHYAFKGKIDNKYEYIMECDINADTISEGYYQYLNQKESIGIKGALKANNLKIVEEDGHRFEGYFDYKTGNISGKWHSAHKEWSPVFSMNNIYKASYPEYDFKVHLVNTVEDDPDFTSRWYGISEIQYTNKKTGEVKSVDVDVEVYSWAYGLSLQDFNFDGYQDIALVWMLPAYPPLRYKFLLYNPDSESFYETSILEDIYTMPSVDYLSKRATSFMEGGRGHSWTYQFENGNYYPFYFENWMYNDETADLDYSYNYYKIENGESVEITKEEFKQINGFDYDE